MRTVPATHMGGATDTYATHPEYSQYGTGAGMHKNHSVDRQLMNSTNTAKYSKKITKNQQTKMFNVINNPKNNTWSYLNNCTTFVSKVFKGATGIDFNSNSPANLHGKINNLKQTQK